MKLITATTTRTWLNGSCEMDPVNYPAGTKMSDEDMAAVMAKAIITRDT